MNSVLHVVIMDDCATFRVCLTAFLNQWSERTHHPLLISTAPSGEEVMDYIANDPMGPQTDVIFLDIDVPGSEWSGMRTAQWLRNHAYRGEIVFVTGYDGYELQGYKVEALDFLRKPCKESELEQCMERLLRRLKEAPDRNLVLQYGRDVLAIPFKEIIHITSDRNHVVIYTADGPTRFRIGMKHIVSLLPKEFVRSHRRDIVNLRHVRALKGNRIVLDNDTSLKMSSKYEAEVRQSFLHDKREELGVPQPPVGVESSPGDSRHGNPNKSFSGTSEKRASQEEILS